MSENTDRTERMTGTPSKDRAEARELAARLSIHHSDSERIATIAAALDKAFAEGMKRAAEIARRQAKFHLDASAMSLPVEPSPIIAKDRAKIAAIIAEAITSEAEAR